MWLDTSLTHTHTHTHQLQVLNVRTNSDTSSWLTYYATLLICKQRFRCLHQFCPLWHWCQGHRWSDLYVCVWLAEKCRQRTIRETFDTLGNNFSTSFFSIPLLPPPAGIVVLSTYNFGSSCNIKTVLRLVLSFLLHISLAAFCTAPMARPLWNLYITQETVCPTLLSSASSLPPSSPFLLPLPSLWLQSLVETPLLLPQFLFPLLLICLHLHPASACAPHNILFISPLK